MDFSRVTRSAIGSRWVVAGVLAGSVLGAMHGYICKLPRVNDIAIGIAMMLEVARALAAREPAPRRTVVFAAVTAEEKGLVGSDFLAQHLPAAVGWPVARGGSQAVIDAYFTGTASKLGGVDLGVIAEEVAQRHTVAYPPSGIAPAHRTLNVGGAATFSSELCPFTTVPGGTARIDVMPEAASRFRSGASALTQSAATTCGRRITSRFQRSISSAAR
mgnify:CR=1 FL=1